jgi:hypothetical protein
VIPNTEVQKEDSQSWSLISANICAPVFPVGVGFGELVVPESTSILSEGRAVFREGVEVGEIVSSGFGSSFFGGSFFATLSDFGLLLAAANLLSLFIRIFS